MSYTINMKKIAVKDESGNYVEFDAFTQMNKDEIEAAKNEAIAAVQNLISKIPEDFQSLANRVETLEATDERIQDEAIDRMFANIGGD